MISDEKAWLLSQVFPQVFCIMDKQFALGKPYAWLLRQFEERPVLRIRGAPKKYHDEGVPQRFVRVSFSELQRLHLRKLQCKLALSAVKITFDDLQNEKEPEGWEDDLKSYSKSTSQRDSEIPALVSTSMNPSPLIFRPEIPQFLMMLSKSIVEGLKDFDYMIGRNSDDADPCLLTAERSLDQQIIEKALGNTNIPRNQLQRCGKMGSKDPLYIPRKETKTAVDGVAGRGFPHCTHVAHGSS